MLQPGDTIGQSQVAQGALELQTRYGDDAPVIAMMKSAEAAAGGDLETSDFWLSVAATCDAPEKH
jgi:hypothetical protein